MKYYLGAALAVSMILASGSAFAQVAPSQPSTQTSCEDSFIFNNAAQVGNDVIGLAVQQLSVMQTLELELQNDKAGGKDLSPEQEKKVNALIAQMKQLDGQGDCLVRSKKMMDLVVATKDSLSKELIPDERKLKINTTILMLDAFSPMIDREQKKVADLIVK